MELCLHVLSVSHHQAAWKLPFVRVGLECSVNFWNKPQEEVFTAWLSRHNYPSPTRWGFAGGYFWKQLISNWIFFFTIIKFVQLWTTTRNKMWSYLKLEHGTSQLCLIPYRNSQRNLVNFMSNVRCIINHGWSLKNELTFCPIGEWMSCHIKLRIWKYTNMIRINSLWI